MPIPHIRMVFYDCCGKLLKVEEFGDAFNLIVHSYNIHATLFDYVSLNYDTYYE